MEERLKPMVSGSRSAQPPAPRRSNMERDQPGIISAESKRRVRDRHSRLLSEGKTAAANAVAATAHDLAGMRLESRPAEMSGGGDGGAQKARDYDQRAAQAKHDKDYDAYKRTAGVDDDDKPGLAAGGR